MLGPDKRQKLISFALDRMNPRLLAWAYRRVQTVPFLQARIEHQYSELLSGVEAELKPYKGRFKAHTRLPKTGTPSTELLAEMSLLAEQEHERWQRGYVSGAVYNGRPDHVKLLSDVYALHSQSNPLHADVWPSATKYESEIVAMTGELLGAAALPRGGGEEVCGTVTSGGTESILLAMKAYRDQARALRNITRPEIVVSETAHAAFDKAAEYFGITRV
ncbi:MAG: aspartate aminotransferase family protein, partial [Polyangiaceae bacterium]